MSGTLYIVGTPIGNLQDLTERAKQTLGAADLIVCEDTRVTRVLLDRAGIRRPLLSYHQHSRLSRIDEIIGHLKVGESAALVSDSGTPGVSDPGNQVVAAAVAAGCPVVPIPGPSALTALLSVAGLSVDRFVFMGFLPHKKGRASRLKEISESRWPVVLYESPHRIDKTIKSLAEIMPGAKLVVGRELTKKFEEIIRGTAAEVLSIFTRSPEKVRGEFALIVFPSIDHPSPRQ